MEVSLSSLQINMVASLFMRTLIVKPFIDGSENEKGKHTINQNITEEIINLINYLCFSFPSEKKYINCSMFQLTYVSLQNAGVNC